MTRTVGMRSVVVMTLVAICMAGAARSADLTADDAVKTAMGRSTQIIGARAGMEFARGSLLSAYSGVLPNITGAYTRSSSRSTNETGTTTVAGSVFPIEPNDTKSNSSSPSVFVSWGILTPSSWWNLSSARSNSRSAKHNLSATRNDVALSVRRQFYEVVKAVKLAEVAQTSLQLSRDDERRVKAMFDVGSVSKSDLLRARVRSADSEVALIQARHQITVQRIELARQMGVEEATMGTVDTLLSVRDTTYDEAAVLAEAAAHRPDLMAAEAALASARANHTAARLQRLPYVTASGSATFDPKTDFTNTARQTGAVTNGESSVDRDMRGNVALRWDVFSLGTVDARIASSKGALLTAQEDRDALRRNLASEVKQAIQTYEEAQKAEAAAESGLESATENLKLTQEKYNVGSATILDLIDAQVQLETARSGVVRALAAIRVAEAMINRVRGRSE